MNVTIPARGHRRRGASAMTIAPENAQQGASRLYRVMRDFVQSADDNLPGKFAITKEASCRLIESAA